MTSLTFQPLIPPSLWVFLALGCGALLAWYGGRRPGTVTRRRWWGILALMGTGEVLVLIILLNPYWRERLLPPGGRPLLTVLVDASASMATPDAGAGATRFDAARRLARGFVEAADGRFETRAVSFADVARPSDIETLGRSRPEGATTDLAAAISGGIDEARPQGQAIVLLSDGIHNAEGQAARVLEAVRVARGLDVPIYTRTIGGEAEVRDLSLELPVAQDVAFVDQEVPVVVNLRRRGLGMPTASVVLSAEGRPIERISASFDAAGLATVRFPVRRPRRGLYVYEARVEPVSGEATAGNNTETFLLKVVDEPVRVLLLEGKPYWDAKFLTRTLASDPSIELDVVVRLAEGRFLRRSLSRRGSTAVEKSEGTRRLDDWKVLATPAEVFEGPAGLGRYQVVVLGRDSEVFLGDEAMGRLRPWIVRDGGALVCYRGAPVAQVGQPLAKLLPVRWSQARESRFRVRLTDRGRELRWFPEGNGRSQDEALARMPTLARDERPGEPRPLAVVLATAAAGDGGDSPVVTYQPYGSGRVVVIEGAGMWRWAFLPPPQREQGQGAVYAGFWQGVMRWLASATGLPPGKNLALRADKVGFRTNEAVTAILLMRQDADRRAVPSIALSGGGLKEAKSFAPVASGDEPGTFRVTFGPLPEGHYQARVAGREESDSDRVAFDVRGLVDEQLDLAARPDLMARIARESGGDVLRTDAPGDLAERFRAHQARSRTEQVRRYPAWDRWWVLATVFLVWGAAWRLRRISGLV